MLFAPLRLVIVPPTVIVFGLWLVALGIGGCAVKEDGAILGTAPSLFDNDLFGKRVGHLLGQFHAQPIGGLLSSHLSSYFRNEGSLLHGKPGTIGIREHSAVHSDISLVSVIQSLHGPNDLGHGSKPRCECHSAKASHRQNAIGC